MAGAYPACSSAFLVGKPSQSRLRSFAACRAGQPPIGLPIAGFGLGEQGFS